MIALRRSKVVLPAPCRVTGFPPTRWNIGLGNQVSTYGPRPPCISGGIVKVKIYLTWDGVEEYKGNKEIFEGPDLKKKVPGKLAGIKIKQPRGNGLLLCF